MGGTLTKGHEMEYDIKEKTFAMSMESLASFLPRQVDCSEDEMRTVEIPGRRYDEITRGGLENVSRCRRPCDAIAGF